jgi:hypothetical protein
MEILLELVARALHQPGISHRHAFESEAGPGASKDQKMDWRVRQEESSPPATI